MYLVLLIIGALVLVCYLADGWLERRKLRGSASDIDTVSENLTQPTEAVQNNVNQTGTMNQANIPNQENETNRANEASQRNEAETDLQTPTSTTLRIVKDVLTMIGCQPHQVGPIDIEAIFQGETFIFRIDNYFVRIWDPQWGSFEEDDPNIPIVRLAINETHGMFGPTILLIGPDEGKYQLYSKYDIMLHPTIPHLDDYLTVILRAFFETKLEFRNKLGQLIVSNETQQNQTPPPTGFDISNN